MTVRHGSELGTRRSDSTTDAGRWASPSGVARATAGSRLSSIRANAETSPIAGSFAISRASQPLPRKSTRPASLNTGQARRLTGCRNPTSTAAPGATGTKYPRPGVLVSSGTIRPGMAGTRKRYRRTGASSKLDSGGHSHRPTSASTLLRDR